MTLTHGIWNYAAVIVLQNSGKTTAVFVSEAFSEPPSESCHAYDQKYTFYCTFCIHRPRDGGAPGHHVSPRKRDFDIDPMNVACKE